MWLNLYILFGKNLHFSHPPLITPSVTTPPVHLVLTLLLTVTVIRTTRRRSSTRRSSSGASRDHLSSDYHEALCRIGARLFALVRRDEH